MILSAALMGATKLFLCHSGLACTPSSCMCLPPSGNRRIRKSEQVDCTCCKASCRRTYWSAHHATALTSLHAR
ncbi:hypothetical protein B0J12DRAFT_255419 [Macrophomina phaseolina]|uniref:Secreted protein n=1 Tax=Macrophomina phaseolina TaxID=35725 RepID=A0ABQ8FZB5_9PEZI|nr:hypothetical protein B0J12DRAFT_255419 [Macrophomina phaseolina]